MICTTFLNTMVSLVYMYIHVSTCTCTTTTPCTGTTNYLQVPVDRHVFTEAARQYYLRVPPMCPIDFAVVLNALHLESMDIGPQDINLTLYSLIHFIAQPAQYRDAHAFPCMA